jgi:hypothetical protein
MPKINLISSRAGMPRSPIAERKIVEGKSGVVEVNHAYNAYYERTSDKLIVEADLILAPGVSPASGSAIVNVPFTVDGIATALQYAALSAVYFYMGNTLKSPAKDGGASTKQVGKGAADAIVAANNIRDFKDAASKIIQKLGEGASA